MLANVTASETAIQCKAILSLCWVREKPQAPSATTTSSRKRTVNGNWHALEVPMRYDFFGERLVTEDTAVAFEGDTAQRNCVRSHATDGYSPNDHAPVVSFCRTNGGPLDSDWISLCLPKEYILLEIAG